jgi:hypothetical protein
MSPMPYAVCLVDFHSGNDLTSFETFDVPSFGDTLCVQNEAGGPLAAYEVVRVVRQVTRTYGGRMQLRAIVHVESRDEGHMPVQERDRISMAGAALVARDILGYGTFDLGRLVCELLRDQQEALVRLRALVPAEEHTGVAMLLAEYLDRVKP